MKCCIVVVKLPQCDEHNNKCYDWLCSIESNTWKCECSQSACCAHPKTSIRYSDDGFMLNEEASCFLSFFFCAAALIRLSRYFVTLAEGFGGVAVLGQLDNRIGPDSKISDTFSVTFVIRVPFWMNFSNCGHLLTFIYRHHQVKMFNVIWWTCQTWYLLHTCNIATVNILACCH